MKSLKEALEKRTGEKFDLQRELPEIGLDDLSVLDTKTIGDEITLWLCTDEENTYIVRDDTAGMHGICLFSTREDQLTLAAWNADFDITALADWIDDEEAMDLAIEDAKSHHWGF